MSREYPDLPIVAVGAAVCHEGRVLIVQRGRPPSQGMWTVPGGVVHLGEPMAEAAAREVREECGIEIAVGEAVGVLDHVVRDPQGRIRFHYAIIDFAARYVGGTLQVNEELIDAAWVAPGELDAYQVSEKAKEVLLKALELASRS
jgi:8-oxo-dGTP diphosphatase